MTDGPRPSSEELVKTIFAAALDKKALDVVSLYMEPLIGLTDYFVIATGANDRQLEAIVDEIERKVRTIHQIHPVAREGKRADSWIVLDFTDVVVHVFLQEARDEYRLEKLWSEARQIRAEDAEAPRS
ncbi:MAG: ribosome silencing factor [Actinomycetia bacterium]|nr:ribosome silencing factor [Actinomycetes bacterium]